MNCELHTTIFHPLELVNLHLCGALTNNTYFETLWPHETFEFGLKSRIDVVDGIARLPQGPGLGIDLDWTSSTGRPSRCSRRGSGRESGMRIIDTHQHLIYPDRFAYGWTAGLDALSGAFTLDDYAALAAAAGITDAIFMETAPDDAYYQDEARFALELAGRADTIVRAVIAGCRPEADAGFEAWLDETDTPLVVGYRRPLHVVPDELSTTDGFRANVRRIGKRGKVFDLCVTQAQLPIGRALAEACPDTQFVLDHCGVPAIAGGDFAGWAAAIDALASLPNVVCKISGVVAYCGPDQDPEAAVRPYVEHCLERFGPDRVVWGGDWPVVNLRMQLPEWVAITTRLVAGLSEAEREKLFAGNAARVYRLPQ